MCKTCGKENAKEDSKRGSGSSRNLPKKRGQKSKEEVSPCCKFCGQFHPEEVTPYVEPFPQIPQYPEEGIYGMYPVASICKRDIMGHMLQFQRELIEQAKKAKMRVKMMEYKAAAEAHDETSDATTRVVNQLSQLDSDIQQLKHELQVDALKNKYGKHADTCPCYTE